MAKIYASLIIKGIKQIGDIPEQIREAVRQALIEAGHPELAGDENAV